MKRQKNDRLDSPQQVGRYMQVSAVNSLLVCLTGILLIASFCLWAFLGTITDKVYYTGVLYPTEGIRGVTLPNGGTVRKLLVRHGEHIKAGQAVALVSMDNSYSIVSSEVNGTIISGKAEGEDFKALEPVVSVLGDNPGSKKGRSMMLIAWADNDTRRALRPGMEAQVWPADEKRDEIGYVVGHVRSVNIYPTTLTEASALLRSETLSRSVLPEKGAAYQVEIALEHAVDDPSVLHWSYGEPDNVQMSAGTVCTVMTETKSRTMMQYLFDQIKFTVYKVYQWVE